VLAIGSLVMLKKNLNSRVALVLLVVLSCGVQGCNWIWPSQPSSPAAQEEQRQRDEKTRDQVADATERMKPAIQSAGRTLNRAAEKAAEEARAAAEGVKEGWTRGANAPLNLNSATEHELTELPGISGPEARKIIRARPYTDKRELVTRGVITSSAYAKIKDEITAK
jgi:DNA uptake protein ComE-like DNA-binding protein